MILIVKGSGIPQVIGEVQGVSTMDWWSVLWKKFVGGLLSISSGLFLGREGPSIQLGSSIGLGVNKLTKGDDLEKNVLLSSGAGAGLAAAFNAPLAGLIFVLEEVHANFSPLVAITTFTSAVVANFISLNIFGLTPALNIGPITNFPLRYYLFLPLLGIFLGLMGRLYNKVLLDITPKFYQLFSFIPTKYNSVLPLLILIPIGYFLPEFIGGGSELVLLLPVWQLSIGVLIGLLVLRFVFSMISFGANIPGGIFLPILSLGAILGSIFAQVLIDGQFIEASYLNHFILLAMAGYFTAIGKAPITAIILVTEMAGGMNQLMPLAVVCLTAYLTADLLGNSPIYESLLERLIPKHSNQVIHQPFSFVYSIETDSKMANLRIQDTTWPENMLISSVRRGSEFIVPKGDTVLKIGDHLMIYCDLNNANILRKKLNDYVL